MDKFSFLQTWLISHLLQPLLPCQQGGTTWCELYQYPKYGTISALFLTKNCSFIRAHETRVERAKPIASLEHQRLSAAIDEALARLRQPW